MPHWDAPPSNSRHIGAWHAQGGVIVLEEPDSASWRYHPETPRANKLIELIVHAFRSHGGDFDAGRRCYTLLHDAGLEPNIRAEIVALPPGHPYLRLPIQFAASLRQRLLTVTDEATLGKLTAEAEQELALPHRWGLTFTLVQTWARLA